MAAAMGKALEEELVEALRMGFIGGGPSADPAAAAADGAGLAPRPTPGSAPGSPRFVPRLLANSEEEHTDVLSELKAQLQRCERFDFSVAFITKGGIETIVQLLLAMRDAPNPVPGHILTTTFNNFNDPEALRKLLEFPNIELRVYEGNLHTKGYFFKEGELNAMVIGSANLTQSALCSNKEWNVLLHSYEDGELYRALRREYEQLWDSAQTVVCTEGWIVAYEQYRASAFEDGVPAPSPRRLAPFASHHEDARLSGWDVGVDVGGAPRAGERTGVPAGVSPAGALPPVKPALPAPARPRIVPNRMQAGALESLRTIHGKGEPRALLISATGTGKTYLAAFDVGQVKPKRVLFVAHRERILDAALKSFRNVLGEAYTYGMYTGDRRDRATCLFAMVGTLARHLGEFDPREFDYIVVDETHRAGARSYLEVLEHFRPGFVLGMTATPQRTDGYDLFRLFNHVIAYRITLQDALANDMLAPFHYYGIADLWIDGEEQDDVSLFARLTSKERVDHIVRKIEDYTVQKGDRRGLVFCSRIEEAQSLSHEFNERGYRTQALSGADPEHVRDLAVERLERGELQYLFSVDIFNEGVDIPTVNQIVMLRPTESAIVFVQQLGRGLRKAPGKESVLVLDFIGNYQNNYLIPIALSGDRTYNKDNLRRFTKEGSTSIPGCSTVAFDRVAEERIFRKLDEVRFGETALIREEYGNLRQMLGRIPSLADFEEQGALDPLLVFAKFGSYHEFLTKYEPDYGVAFDQTRRQMLRYVSQKLADGRRPDELEVLRGLVGEYLRRVAADKAPRAQKTPQAGADVARWVFPGGCGELRMASVAACLDGGFTLSSQRKTFSDCRFARRCGDGGLEVDPLFARALEDPEFARQMLELVDFGLGRSSGQYAGRYADTSLVLYQKYSYEQAQRMLEWPVQQSAQTVGGYMYNAATNTFPVFINYNKAADISDTIRYEDRFLSDRELIAISKQPRTMSSPEIVRLRDIASNGMRVYLFVRKNKDDADGGKEFYFLGSMAPTQYYREFTMPNTTKVAVEIGYRLDVPVRPDIYDYLIN